MARKVPIVKPIRTSLVGMVEGGNRHRRKRLDRMLRLGSTGD